MPHRAEFGELARARVDLTHELRQALVEKSLAVAFQPIVRASDGIVVGIEALARLSTPSRGPVGPSEFIPIAESTGLIGDVGYQVREIAYAWLRQWLDDGHDVTLALNVSPFNLGRPGLGERLARSAKAHGILPANVTLEITESAIVSGTEGTLSLLDSLRMEGYAIAVDDFGTGYSMLTSLRRLPVSSIKIDKEFVDEVVSNERSRVIAKMATDLGHGLGLTVVAEGVETAEQRDVLLALGVDEFQGYYFARPMPGEEIGPFITAQRRRAASLA